MSSSGTGFASFGVIGARTDSRLSGCQFVRGESCYLGRVTGGGLMIPDDDNESHIRPQSYRLDLFLCFLLCSLSSVTTLYDLILLPICLLQQTYSAGWGLFHCSHVCRCPRYTNMSLPLLDQNPSRSPASRLSTPVHSSFETRVSLAVNNAAMLTLGETSLMQWRHQRWRSPSNQHSLQRQICHPPNPVLRSRSCRLVISFAPI